MKSGLARGVTTQLKVLTIIFLVLNMRARVCERPL